MHLLRELIQAQGESIFSGSSDGLYVESIVFQSELLRINFIARRMHESDSSSHALDSCIGDHVVLKLIQGRETCRASVYVVVSSYGR